MCKVGHLELFIVSLDRKQSPPPRTYWNLQCSTVHKLWGLPISALPLFLHMQTQHPASVGSWCIPVVLVLYLILFFIDSGCFSSPHPCRLTLGRWQSPLSLLSCTDTQNAHNRSCGSAIRPSSQGYSHLIYFICLPIWFRRKGQLAPSFMVLGAEVLT